jgi:hypothetical protein
MKTVKSTLQLGSTTYQVDSRVLDLFNKLASDKRDTCLSCAAEHVSQGKSVERALADALETFKLV